MNSESTRQRPYELPFAATSAPALAVRLGEPTGLAPNWAGGDDPIAQQSGDERDVEEEELSLAELTGGLLRGFEVDEENAEDPAPVAIALQLDELTTDNDDGADDGMDVPLYGLMRQTQEGDSDPSEEPVELSLQFGIAELPSSEPEDGASEDPLDPAALFGASGFTNTLAALEEEDEEGDVSVGTLTFADEAPLPRRVDFVVERRISGACTQVCPLPDGDLVAVHPASLTFFNRTLDPYFDIDVPSGVRHAVSSCGQLVVLQGNGQLAWFQLARGRRRWERSRSLYVQVPCQRVLASGPQLLVVSEHGRYGWIADREVRWLTWPDPILTGESGDPAVLIANGRLGPYLLCMNAAYEPLSGPPLLDALPRRGLRLSTLGDRRWIYAPNVGVWCAPHASQAARRVAGFSQVCALTAAREQQRDVAWLALEARGGVLDVVRLEQSVADAVVVARVELESEESSADALFWDEPTRRLFICSDESLLVLKPHHPTAAFNEEPQSDL